MATTIAAGVGVVTVILDQFYSPSPSQLQQAPMRWADFLRQVEAGQWTRTPAFRAPEIVTGDRVTLPWCTTAYREDAKGYVAVWRTHWDSSG